MRLGSSNLLLGQVLDSNIDIDDSSRADHGSRQFRVHLETSLATHEQPLACVCLYGFPSRPSNVVSRPCLVDKYLARMIHHFLALIRLHAGNTIHREALKACLEHGNALRAQDTTTGNMSNLRGSDVAHLTKLRIIRVWKSVLDIQSEREDSSTLSS